MRQVRGGPVGKARPSCRKKRISWNVFIKIRKQRSMHMLNRGLLKILFAAAIAYSLGACTQTDPSKQPDSTPPGILEAPAVKVKELQLNRILETPGELKAFQNVAIQAKVEGYISWIGVDRGSKLNTDDKILTIFCPELDEHAK